MRATCLLRDRLRPRHAHIVTRIPEKGDSTRKNREWKVRTPHNIPKKTPLINSRIQTMQGYKRIFFIGLIAIVLGIILSTALSDKLGSLGIVFIAIGGLLFIASMSRKKKEESEAEKERRK